MPTNNDGWTSRVINRKISDPISRFIVAKLPFMSPNQMSILSFLICLSGAILLGLGNAILAGILIQLGSILDGCDGEIARYSNKESEYGGYFDAMLDRYADFLLFLGASFYCFNQDLLPITESLLLGGFALIGSFLISYTAAKGEIIGLKFSKKLEGRDTRLFLLFVGGIGTTVSSWSIPLTLGVIGVLTHITLVKRLTEVKNKTQEETTWEEFPSQEETILK
jgi:CDP-L-myo-inositol myo-inositolphosphotransferase